MKYTVKEPFTVKTSQGEQVLQAEQVIILPHEAAIRLLNEDRITPVGKVAYRIYSNILQAFLWVVQDDAGAEELRAEGIDEIYTGYEIAELKKMPKEALKAIHSVKQAFPKSIIKDVKRQKQA